MIVIDKFPPYADADDVGLSIGKRAEEYSWHARHPELGALTGLPITECAGPQRPRRLLVRVPAS